MDLKIACGSWYHPKPSMEFPSGQDCHFHSAHRKIFGVADGVGGYRVRGIDSGIYARELMCNAVDAIAELFKLPCRKHNNIENIPLEVMKKAFDKTTALGASTACIISLVGQDIRAANIGDSSFVVVRSGVVIYHSPEQCSSSNCPAQLGRAADNPTDAQLLHFKNVREGDVIVAGTDGLFDNLFDEEIAFAVTQAKEHGMGAQPIAQVLGDMALVVSKDTSRETPFMVKRLTSGHALLGGGKVDDITVIVADVCASTAVEQTPAAGVFLCGRQKGSRKKKVVETWFHIARHILVQQMKGTGRRRAWDLGATLLACIGASIKFVPKGLSADKQRR